MRSDIPADCEKTQAPPTRLDFEQKLREARREQNGYADRCCETARPMSSEEVLAELFRYHAPTPETLPKYAAINQAAKNFAEVVLQNCPAGADRADAINSIRVARMVANAAIALNGLSLY